MEENFEENIGLLIHDVARLLRVLYDRQMASIGLTRSQWWVLTYLRFKEGINQSDLASLILDPLRWISLLTIAFSQYVIGF